MFNPLLSLTLYYVYIESALILSEKYYCEGCPVGSPRQTWTHLPPLKSARNRFTLRSISPDVKYHMESFSWFLAIHFALHRVRKH